ncbi:ABC transporter ATP-binding protein [Kribbia dieselivorans]|uniref:ABC transporter ATP-binding protein n=1 Tax=Kribbia dieselivorans TaxID=331526 RepID=UPI00083829A9|nr:ABC transporter ATP-binding protein [Kribbia dieselivorans]
MAVEAAVAVRGVTKTYRSGPEKVRAVDDVTLHADAGEMVALMGPSGCGKSTLLSLIGGLLQADGGHIEVLGRDLVGQSAAERTRMRLLDMGVVFQADNLLEDLTCVENVALPLSLRSGSTLDPRVMAREALDRMGIIECADRFPRQMSGGQRQRAGIARAMAGGRRVLLADEPTGALDSRNSADVFDLLRGLAGSGVAVLVVSHDEMVREYATRVLGMRDGRLVAAA